MEEQLISFETAKLAKEKGFNIPQNKMFSYGVKLLDNSPSIKFNDGEKYECAITPFNWNDDNSFFTKTKYFSRPSQSLLQKWLREIHGIKIGIIPTFNCYNIAISQYNKEEDQNDLKTPEGLEFKDFTKYEEALEIALQESLKLI